MPYISQGSEYKIYGIFQKTRNDRTRSAQDIPVSATMSTRPKRQYLHFFKNLFPQKNSQHYSKIHDYINQEGRSKFYVRVLGKGRYSEETSKDEIYQLQIDLGVMFPYSV